MDFVRPATLPAFLDDFLVSLPDPFYGIAVKFLSQLLALLGAIYELSSSLISTDSSKWDAQKLLPPIITLLAAYLALLSLYRTMSWAIRFSFSLLKWGVILALLFSGTAWYMGSHNTTSIANSQTLSTAGTALFNYLTNQPIDSSQRRTQRLRRSNGRSSSGADEQPSVWDSFTKHKEWRDRKAGSAPPPAVPPAHDILQDVMNIASKYAAGSSSSISGMFEAVLDALDLPSREEGASGEGHSRSR